ncbi:MAG TPA: type II toxin-antitoxin system RelE/ParE family toxin [Lacunisphaera sp.]|nr:type II toxin-antitoxin system RelE/ParE family toxin [Lacunisphaera sp.]
MSIVWSDESRRSLRAIRRFIANDSDYYADQMVARIVERVEHAAKAPLQGHRVHEYPEAPLREVHESPYRIIYRISETELEVVTVVHFKQELPPKRLRQ